MLPKNAPPSPSELLATPSFDFLAKLEHQRLLKRIDSWVESRIHVLPSAEKSELCLAAIKTSKQKIQVKD